MANETVYKYGTTKVLANADGASVINNQMSTAASTLYSQTDTLDYPDAVFVLVTKGFGAAPTAGSTIDLYIRPMDIDGTTDAPVPASGVNSAYKGVYIGSFVLKDSAASGDAYRCVGYDIPRAGEAYLFNNGTGQTLTGGTSPNGWTLKMTPRTVGPL